MIKPKQGRKMERLPARLVGRKSQYRLIQHIVGRIAIDDAIAQRHVGQCAVIQIEKIAFPATEF